MKVFSCYTSLVTIAALANAFPAAVLEKAAQDPKLVARANDMLEHLKGRQSVATADGATLIFEPVPTFDEKAQFINVAAGSGHEWQAPGKNDLRGPCPGLNAFANHGFLPRNGYGTITQFIQATGDVVGMGPALGAFLAALGATIDGDGTAWSIGGTPPAGVGGPLAGQGHGISGSHNKYESDASPTRPDLYQTGNDYQTMSNQFNQLISMSPGGFVDLKSLTNFRSARFDHQVQTNPYFFNGPFTGVAVQPAAYTFIYRFMANHSAEHPVGYLSYSVLASWFGMKANADGTYTAQQGQERIPENWYRRALAYPYENDYFVADAANAIALFPKFANIGGNLGTPNSFTGINVEDFSGGLINGQNLTKGDNFACLAYQFAAQAKPDVALGSVLQLTNAITPLLSNMGCPQLKAFDDAQLAQFPGYQKANV